MAASKFFGRVAEFFRNGKNGRTKPSQETAEKQRSNIGATAPSTKNIQATTGSAPKSERSLGSFSGAGGDHSFAPKQSGMHKPANQPARGAWRDKPMTPGAFGPHGTQKLEKRNQFENTESPKGLWSETKSDRLSDPFSERPSKAPPSRPSAHSIH